MTTKCGTHAGYQVHRRDKVDPCEPCRWATAVYEKRRRLAEMAGASFSVPPHGTQRRLRALAAIGWDCASLGQQLGTTSDAVSDMARIRKDYVTRTTAVRVAALYDHLSMRPGPSPIAKRRAQAKGWAPPLAWDDDTIDDPSAVPFGVPMSSKGAFQVSGRPVFWDDLRWEDVDRLRECGVADEQIAERFGISEKSLLKAEARWGRGAVA